MYKHKLIEALINIEKLGLECSIASFQCGKTLSDKDVSKKRKADSDFCNAVKALREQVIGGEL